MPSCTFFGHRDCPDSLKQSIRAVIIDLITSYGVDMFYVGHQGGFDRLVRSVLREVTQDTPGCVMLLCRLICPQSTPSWVIPLTQCCRRGSSWFTPATPSLGATIGCCRSPILWLPTWPTPGAGQPSMYKRPSDPARP